MSLEPNDPAAEAFERLRLEVALLRRAIEGLAADAGVEPIDYSPTLAELADAVAEASAQLAALGERPALALAPEQLGALLHQAAGQLLAKAVAELERERAVLSHAAEALRVACEADMARSRSWRRLAKVAGAGGVAGGILWGISLGPLARALPSSWGAPERLAADTLALPMRPAAERLLRRGDPDAWETLQLIRALPDGSVNELRRCVGRSAQSTKAKTCTLKLRE